MDDLSTDERIDDPDVLPTDSMELLERCLAAEGEPDTEDEPKLVEARPVVLEPDIDAGVVRYKRPKPLRTPGLANKMLEVLDMETVRSQLRAVWGKNGPEDNADLLAFALEDTLDELEPRDSVERLLVHQMFVIHRQVMTMIHRSNENLSPRDARGYNDVVTRLATAFRRHYEELRKHRAPAATVAIHGDGNTINLAAAQQVISEGDPAQMRELVSALEGLTGALKNKLEGEGCP